MDVLLAGGGEGGGVPHHPLIADLEHHRHARAATVGRVGIAALETALNGMREAAEAGRAGVDPAARVQQIEQPHADQRGCHPDVVRRVLAAGVLDEQHAGVPKALWERFNGACEKAYAPAARFFAEQAAQRKQSRKQREEFIAAAAAHAPTLLTEPREDLRRVFYYGYHNDEPSQMFRSSLPIGRVLEDPPGWPPVIACSGRSTLNQPAKTWFASVTHHAIAPTTTAAVTLTIATWWWRMKLVSRSCQPTAVATTSSAVPAA